MATEDMPPTTLNPAPATVACEIVTEAVPVLLSVRVCGLVEPSTTFPNVRLVLLAASVPEEEEVVDAVLLVGVPAPVRPTQPASDNAVRVVMISAKALRRGRRLDTTCE